ncbi:hypothetical protein [Oceanicoccus sagamiensis]|uniref:DUF4124 domain-containing protein n=1 Tax=Oceanicoccus sagamiensis TaxID=716816 RepID=A0A1X9NFR6_9GAMM|nr:hypothetical protein [Oceanicoccus sagamiensis]ARN76346.1 hypothetical protein BST96_08575 [Oceanicoccus sagamiensis]
MVVVTQIQRLLRHFSVFTVAAVFLLSSSSLVQGADQLYRYINDKGVPVINDNIPPEFVAGGYDIIRPDGSLLRSVPRQLSEEELQLRNTEESRARFQEEEDARLRAWDESLMLRYSDLDDIEAAQSRTMRDLKIRISILKSNLVTIKSQIEREQQKAADIERRGGTVPEDLSKNINTLRLEIEDTEQSIVVRNVEIESVKASYQRDMDRFKTLIERVEMRRIQSQPAKSNRPTYY